MSVVGNIKESIYKTKKITGVELSIQQDGTFLFNLILLGKKGGSLVPGEKLNDNPDKENVLKTLNTLKTPVILNIQGKGTINRAFQDSVKNNFAEALNRVVPGSNELDFHIQIYNGHNGNSFVSIVRNQLLQEILNEFRSNDIEVIGVLLGNFHLELLLPLIENSSSIQKINTAGNELIFEDGSLREVVNIESNKQAASLDIEGTDVANNLLPALAAAMFYFIPLPKIVNNSKEISDLAKEYANKKTFVTLSRALIVFLLSLTLGNFFLFNSYFKKQKDIEGELSVYESSISRFEELNKQLKSKQDFIDKSGLQSNSKLSYYTDRLLYDMPEDVRLAYFNIAPNIKRPEKDSIIRFDSKKILIKGNCTKSIVLNEWIKLIKSKGFVEDVLLENYNQESEKSSGKFDLAVKLK